MNRDIVFYPDEIESIQARIGAQDVETTSITSLPAWQTYLDLYLEFPEIFAPVHKTASASSVDYYFATSDGQTLDKWQERVEQELALYSLFNRANLHDLTFGQVLYATVKKRLFIIPSNEITVWEQKDMTLDNFTWQVDQITHRFTGRTGKRWGKGQNKWYLSTRPSSTSMYFGESPLTSLYEVLNLLILNHRSHTNHYKNNNALGNVIQTEPELGEEDFKALQQTVRQLADPRSQYSSIVSSAIKDIKRIPQDFSSSLSVEDKEKIALHAANCIGYPFAFLNNKSQGLGQGEQKSAMKIYYNEAIKPLHYRRQLDFNNFLLDYILETVDEKPFLTVDGEKVELERNDIHLRFKPFVDSFDKEKADAATEAWGKGMLSREQAKKLGALDDDGIYNKKSDQEFYKPPKVSFITYQDDDVEVEEHTTDDTKLDEVMQKTTVRESKEKVSVELADTEGEENPEITTVQASVDNYKSTGKRAVAIKKTYKALAKDFGEFSVTSKLQDTKLGQAIASEYQDLFTKHYRLEDVERLIDLAKTNPDGLKTEIAKQVLGSELVSQELVNLMIDTARVGLLAAEKQEGAPVLSKKLDGKNGTLVQLVTKVIALRLENLTGEELTTAQALIGLEGLRDLIEEVTPPGHDPEWLEGTLHLFVNILADDLTQAFYTIDQIQALVISASEEDRDRDTASQNIADRLDALALSRAKTNTLDNTSKLFTLGYLVGGFARGMKSKTWLRSRSENERESHLQLVGQTVSYDQAFSNGEEWSNITINCLCGVRVNY